MIYAGKRVYVIFTRWRLAILLDTAGVDYKEGRK